MLSRMAALMAPPPPEVSQFSTERYIDEPFETYKLKVIQLMNDLGHGEPLALEDLLENEMSRITGLQLTTGPDNSPKKYILRASRNLPGRQVYDDLETKDLEHGLGRLQFLSQHGSLHAPAVLSFGSTRNNVLGQRYILWERFSGTSIERIFNDVPLSEKISIAALVARLIVDIETIQFESAGDLWPATEPKDCPPASQRLVVRGFFSPRIEVKPPLEKQPLKSLLIEMLEHNKAGDEDGVETFYMTQLQKVVKQMSRAGLMRNTDDTCVLWHRTISVGDIFIRQTNVPSNEALGAVVEGDAASRYEITGVLGWQGSLSVPRVLAREPPAWLWGSNDGRPINWSPSESIEPEHLSQDDLTIKAAFDQTMRMINPSYFEDAYIRGPWLREIFRFARYGVCHIMSRYEFRHFIMDWKEYYATFDISEQGDDTASEVYESPEDEPGTRDSNRDGSDGGDSHASDNSEDRSNHEMEKFEEFVASANTNFAGGAEPEKQGES